MNLARARRRYHALYHYDERNARLVADDSFISLPPALERAHDAVLREQGRRQIRRELLRMDALWPAGLLDDRRVA